MCMKRTCSTCQKATWFGCGKHIPSVMDSIAEDDRCTCKPTVEVDGKTYPPKQGEGHAS
ncbi:hypothetical protein EDD36DRAFT_443892 [Exophiala viscosa]|uniref:Uncharacterized protein n=1 Tax=Exophiala viscosa TaxID=2486360 RepID=A0AAN6DS71_9EURO|nr:hypothetical protein EDD36DRAFT_443892 [Exophiala viscosa]